MRPRGRAVRDAAPAGLGQHGAAAVEWLLALPALLLLGLGLIQFALIYQARHALDHALWQAARAGSVEHAGREAIVQGLASGITPWLSGADATGLLAAEALSRGHVEAGLGAGWIRLRQRSPLAESFDDWAVPALDAFGDPIAGMVEIPNDNLDSRRTRMQPASGVASLQDDEPIGRASAQTLADANLLRLEMVYGFRLAVPLVGRLLIATLSALEGCTTGPGGAPAVERLGLIRLGAPAPGGDPASTDCAIYAARDAGGAGRIPLRLSATVRMMSTARRSPLTAARSDVPSGLATLGTGGTGAGPAAPDAVDGRGQDEGRQDRDAAGREPAGSAGGEAGVGADRGAGDGSGNTVGDGTRDRADGAAGSVLPDLVSAPPAASRPGQAHPAVCPPEPSSR